MERDVESSDQNCTQFSGLPHRFVIKGMKDIPVPYMREPSPKVMMWVSLEVHFIELGAIRKWVILILNRAFSFARKYRITIFFMFSCFEEEGST